MKNIKILDGAMGSEFIRRGIILPNHIWSAQLNLEAQEIILKIHKEYIDAGSDYLTTNTFRTTPRSYIKTGLSLEEAELVAKSSLTSSIDLAKSASNENTIILGSIAPLEDCYKPELFPGADIAKKEFRQLSKWFSSTQIDIFLLETMNSIIETKTALDELSMHNKPIWVSFVLKDNTTLLSGETLKDAINMLENYNIKCLLINCSPLIRTQDCLEIIDNNWNKEWGIYPNLGHGEPTPDGNINSIHKDEDFLKVCQNAIDLGANIIGGCCGSTPHHIRLLKNNIN